MPSRAQNIRIANILKNMDPTVTPDPEDAEELSSYFSGGHATLYDIAAVCLIAGPKGLMFALGVIIPATPSMPIIRNIVMVLSLVSGDDLCTKYILENIKPPPVPEPEDRVMVKKDKAENAITFSNGPTAEIYSTKWLYSDNAEFTTLLISRDASHVIIYVMGEMSEYQPGWDCKLAN